MAHLVVPLRSHLKRQASLNALPNYYMEPLILFAEVQRQTQSNVLDSTKSDHQAKQRKFNNLSISNIFFFDSIT